MEAIDYINDLKKRVGSLYIYGAKQNAKYDRVITMSDILKLQKMYGNAYVWDTDLNKAGNTCCDCSGFVDYLFQKGYNSDLLYLNAGNIINIRTKNGNLNNKVLNKVPLGAIVWQRGHVGVFIGYIGKTAYYIAQDGSRANCRIAKLSKSGFTHALYNIKGYNINFYVPQKFKVAKTTYAYTTNKAKVKKKKFIKGTKVNAVARLNNYVLCKKYSYNQDCWVNVKDLIAL